MEVWEGTINILSHVNCLYKGKAGHDVDSVRRWGWELFYTDYGKALGVMVTFQPSAVRMLASEHHGNIWREIPRQRER